MGYTIKNVISKNRVPRWGNQRKYIAVHYLGVVGQNHELAEDGCGAHFYIYWDGTIYQRCDLDAIVWAVGTAGYYTQKHPTARNANTISIEMCCKCDGNASSAEDKKWYFTPETQEACVWLVQKLMREQGIPAENVLRHYDIVNKTCPAPYVHNNKYKTSWTWDEFKKRVSGQNTQPAGTSAQNTDKIWLGWTKRESGSAGFRQTNGDSGNAYGKYQFDRRYALVPFMRFCREYDAGHYAGFETYISHGAGSAALQNNSGLAKLWVQLCDKYPVEFETLQDVYAYQYYYLEAKKYIYNLYDVQMDNHGPAVKGSLFSMAIRSGALTAARKFAKCTDQTPDATMINYAYATYGGQDANRWTKAGQWGDALKALETGEYTAVRRDMDGGDILPETDAPWYRVRMTWADAKSQIEAYHDLNLAKACADKHPGYYVFDESGKAIYPVKTTNPVNPILEQCAKFQKQLASDLAAGKSWEYHNPSKYLEEQWANALSKGKRACNCALLARWALKEAGLIPQTTGIFYGAKGGTIKWGSGAKEAVSKTCDIIKVQIKTVKELISSGELLPGDIVTYVDLQHTNIYAGDGKWYDAGHAYCSGSGEGAKYKSWYGAGTCDGQKVGYVIRQKGSGNAAVSTAQYIVQAGSYKSKANADKQAAKIKAAGFDVLVKPGDDGQYKIQCGVFKDRDLAEALVKKLEAKGLKAIIK